MEELKQNIRTVLDGQPRGLTAAQILRLYKKTAGNPLQLDDGQSIESILKSMSDTIRSERASWGDTLYFLRLEPIEDGGSTANSVDSTIPTLKDDRGRYDVEEEVRKLVEDQRGLCTICWNVFRGDTEAKIQERFTLFGEVIEARLDKGKAFVRYASRASAEAAIRELGPLYFIEASRNVSKSPASGVQKTDPSSGRAAAQKEEINSEKPVLSTADGAYGAVSNSGGDIGHPDLEIYVFDLPLECDEVDLEEMFLDYDVTNIRMNASKSKRTAFVELGSIQEVEKALTVLCDQDNQRHYLARYKTLVRLLPRDPALKAKFLSKSCHDTSQSHQNGSDIVTTCCDKFRKMKVRDSTANETSPPPQQVNVKSSELSGDSSLRSKQPTPTDNGASGDVQLCKHAMMPCRKYPKCLPNCDFKHPLCPLGIQCLDRYCSFDHLHRPKKCHLCLKQSRDLAEVHSIITQCEHRKSACTDFPKCPYGVKCSFKHPSCPDPDCMAWDTCAFEHDGQQKICHVCWKALKASEDKTKDQKENGAEVKTSKGASWSLKENVPCRYGAKCWTPQCPYKHPPEWSKRACPWGHRCRREKCTVVHPPITA